MLRPEQMSRVSVTGSKQVMESVVETVHDLRLVDLSDYDGAWEGFEPGQPAEGGDEASEKLVTVRSLKSILDVEEADAGPTRLVTEEALDEELADIRAEVNELDDRREELRDELRTVEERIDSVEPFAALGIDLDLLTGYDSLAVGVGEGDPETIEAELAGDDSVAAFEVFSEGDAVAVFVYPEATDPVEEGVDASVQDLLVGANFQAYDVPDAEGSPEEYISELQHRKQQLESKLDTVGDELEDLKLDVAGFLLAAEETLAIDAQKAEAPLSFATTENAFVAEGWLPTNEYERLERALEETVGDHVEVEELERADYDEDGHATHSEDVTEGPPAAGGTTETDLGTSVSTDGAESAADAEAEEQEQETVADGGSVTMGSDAPPVIQDNPGAAKPFEALVEVINRPKYSEFDPTVLVFLTFPAFFGFMIGDLGYGIAYLALGYWLYSSFDSDVIRSLGGVGMWAGGFTALFGILYGEIFGLHLVSTYLWEGALAMSSAPLHKGLQPVHGDFALAWLVLSLLAGMLHLAIGWILDFIENLKHGFMDALGESGSWLMMMFGLWAWIFAGAFGKAPPILYGAESVFNGHPIPLGFTGFSPTIGLAGLAVFFVGLGLLTYTEPIEFVEFLNVLVNVLSYTRLAAVLLAKAGMAFVVNLLFFGVYVTHGEHGAAWHFGLTHMPHVGDMVHGHEVTAIMFPGLAHSGIAGLVGGLLVLLVGHLLVLALGVTSAGLQAVRLEYVEFFGKFYEGGGRAYTPFGYDRQYTTED